MSEARNVIILILVLLFVFVGVSVAISRISRTSEGQDSSRFGFLQRIFSDAEDTDLAADTTDSASGATTDTTEPENTGFATPTPSAQAQGQAQDQGNDVAYTFAPTAVPTQTQPTSTKGDTTTPTPSMQKGGVPTEIPSTGANPFVLLFGIAGVASGVYLHKKA